ncbi:NAD(P)-dependent oxidoreductase [Prauserella sp. PE36]|uniref:SDR family oxidoreductase n=1 Tax=Prauserella sp. PE36 TaxID=1504709 RepID=UPI000D88EB2A|nr:SDR family oxidoreductase [Prauserella sp. PE36]PXY37097.1 NAD(P)-dependent oxidoreductase [Prauserella coralliicola]RBM10249.1 NAD(P)-dependent oxidoreductase [Prauserella sp. PE36]
MIVVTGANGHLGRLVIEALKQTVPAGRIVAAARRPEKAADLGVEVREADYDRPDTLKTAFDGAEKVLLISGSEVGKRVPQHTAVVEAAEQAGVSLLAYTSAPKADTSPLILAPEHKATEEVIRDSGLPYAILRNNWYIENYEQSIRQAAETGAYVGSAGEGRVAGATRADYAAGAAAVLAGEGHENKVYEFSGDTAFSYADIAAAVAEATGKDVTYQDLSPEDHRAALLAAGLPEETAGFLVALDGNTRDGLLSEATGELARLIGRPTTPLRDAVAKLLA